MKFKSAILTTCSTALSLLYMSEVQVCQAVGPPAKTSQVSWGPVTNGFQISAYPDKPSFGPAEPVVVRIDVRNATTSSLPFLAGSPITAKDFTISVTDEHDKAVPLTTYGQQLKFMPLINPNFTNVPAGGELHYWTDLNLVYDMTTSGTYLVTINHAVQTHDSNSWAELKSIPLTLHIAEQTEAGASQHLYAYVANRTSDTISQFQVNNDGTLLPLFPNTIKTGKGPCALAVDASGHFLYVVNAVSNSISAYRITQDGTLLPLAAAPVPTGSDPSSIALTPTGKTLYVTNRADQTISKYRRRDDGILVPMLPATPAAGNGPSSIAVDPSGHFAFIANFGSGSISQYQIKPDGGLAPLEPAAVLLNNTRPIDAPRSLTIDPSGQFLYVGTQKKSILQFSIGKSGTLTLLTPDGISVDGYPIAITTDHAGHLYATEWYNKAVAQYQVSAVGVPIPLTPTAAPTDSTPLGVSVDPTGQWVYVVNEEGPSISQFSIQMDGTLTPLNPPHVYTDASPVGIVLAVVHHDRTAADLDEKPEATTSSSVTEGYQLVAHLEKPVSLPTIPTYLDVVIKRVANPVLPLPSITDPLAGFDINIRDQNGRSIPLTSYGKLSVATTGFRGLEVTPRDSGSTYKFLLNRLFDMSTGGIYYITVKHPVSNHNRNGVTQMIVNDIKLVCEF